MSHQILQRFHIHTCIHNISAENVRGRVRQGLICMKLHVFLHRPVHFILNIRHNLWMHSLENLLIISSSSNDGKTFQQENQQITFPYL